MKPTTRLPPAHPHGPRDGRVMGGPRANEMRGADRLPAQTGGEDGAAPDEAQPARGAQDEQGYLCQEARAVNASEAEIRKPEPVGQDPERLRHAPAQAEDKEDDHPSVHGPIPLLSFLPILAWSTARGRTFGMKERRLTFSMRW